MTKEQAIEVLHELDGSLYDTQQVALDMAIKALEIVEEFEKAQIITGGRLNGRTYAYKCGLEDGKRKALEQHTSDDVMAIHTQGLDEGVRCAMCTNSMKSDRGCDGGCVVDEDMYKKVMDTIRNLIVPPVTPTQRWIPISKTTQPKENEAVLITYKFSGKRITTKAYRQSNGWEFENGGWIPNELVVAWQPLPQAYEEKRGDENE